MVCQACQSNIGCLCGIAAASQNAIYANQNYQGQLANIQAMNSQLYNINKNQANIDSFEVQTFLRIIEDKNDEQAAVAFVEDLLKSKRQCEEVIKKQTQEYSIMLTQKEETYLRLCAKYRPSINSQLLERVKKQKAFL